MNTRLIVCSVAAVVSLAGRAAEAQDHSAPDRPISFGFMVAADQFTGGFRGGAEQATGGASAGIEAQMPLPSRHLALRADFLYFMGASGNSICGSFVGLSGGCEVAHAPGQAYAWSADIVARLNDRSVPWSPYILAGGAIYGYPDPGPVVGLARNGLQAGVGFEVRPTKHTNVFAELRYMSFGRSGLAPVTIGARF
jgi:hypothetical protein